MPQDALKPAIRLALRLHEIGDGSPYRLAFAGKAKSGASFGFMQGDLAAGQPEVQRAFRTVLTAAGMSENEIDSLVRRLSVHLISNPLSAAETARVNAALLAGRATVDIMDESILGNVYRQMDECVASAAQAGRAIIPKALLYIALWINMSGYPNKLLLWLSGRDPHLEAPVAAAPSTVDGSAMEGYLRATSYYISNPGNFSHLLSCVSAGAALLPAGEPPVQAAALAIVPAAALAVGPVADAVTAPMPGGWVLHVQRLRQERRPGEGFDRTVGRYAVFHDGRPAGIEGMTVERQGPGNNGAAGSLSHTCIESGQYPLAVHATPKYATRNFQVNGNHPRPAIEVGNTGHRVGILIHPADRYGSTIGCINLAGQLDDAESDISLPDSIARVVDLIDDIGRFIGGAWPTAGAALPSVHLKCPKPHLP